MSDAKMVNNGDDDGGGDHYHDEQSTTKICHSHERGGRAQQLEARKRR